MLQDIRQSTQGTAAKIIIGLIVLSFAGFGVQSILLDGGGRTVAEVNGEGIAPEELQQAVYTQRQRLIAMMGENLDPAMLDEDRLSGQALESLIARKLLTQSAQHLDLGVSEREIGAQVAGMEQFQVGGKFSPDMYKSALANFGFSPASFKRALSDDIVVNQIRSGLSGSEFSTPAERALNARVLAEQRDLRYMTIPREAFAVTEMPQESEIQAWYDSNQERYRSTESVDIEYLELTAEDFYAPVDESLVLEAYEQARNDHQYQPRSKVSHILFMEEGDKSVDERVAEAQNRLAAGEEFAVVAGDMSDDVGSATLGGDLGFTSGDAFPAEMEAVISQLQAGEISEPVATDAGVHLVMVTGREDAEVPPLEEMRSELEARIQQQEAAVELTRAVELLRDISFNAENLSGPAQELELELQSAGQVSRTQAEGLFANTTLPEAAYSDDVLAAGNNSDVIELAGDHYVVLRVASHNEPELKDLDTVRESIVAEINDERTREALTAEAEGMMAALRGGQSMEQLATEKGYEWQVELGVDRRNSTVPFEALNKSFELPRPPEGGASSELVYSAAGDVVVLELMRVIEGDYTALADQEKQQMRQLGQMEYGALLNTEYERGLREGAEINTVL